MIITKTIIAIIFKTRLASSQWTRAWRHSFPFLFTTRYPIRQKVPWENQWKLLRVVGFRNNRVEDKGKTTGNRFDFEIAGLLRLNLVRNIEGPLCSEIPPRVARCWAREVVFVLIEWLWQFQYPCDFLSHKHYRESNTNLSKRLFTHHYFSLSHTEIENFETQNRAKVTQGATLC